MTLLAIWVALHTTVDCCSLEVKSIGTCQAVFLFWEESLALVAGGRLGQAKSTAQTIWTALVLDYNGIGDQELISDCGSLKLNSHLGRPTDWGPHPIDGVGKDEELTSPSVDVGESGSIFIEIGDAPSLSIYRDCNYGIIVDVAGGKQKVKFHQIALTVPESKIHSQLSALAPVNLGEEHRWGVNSCSTDQLVWRGPAIYQVVWGKTAPSSCSLEGSIVLATYAPAAVATSRAGIVTGLAAIGRPWRSYSRVKSSEATLTIVPQCKATTPGLNSEVQKPPEAPRSSRQVEVEHKLLESCARLGFNNELVLEDMAALSDRGWRDLVPRIYWGNDCIVLEQIPELHGDKRSWCGCAILNCVGDYPEQAAVYVHYLNFLTQVLATSLDQLVVCYRHSDFDQQVRHSLACRKLQLFGSV